MLPNRTRLNYRERRPRHANRPSDPNTGPTRKLRDIRRAKAMKEVTQCRCYSYY